VITLALGFGRTQATAIDTAQSSLRIPFRVNKVRYLAGWVSYDAHLNRPPARFR
jgi:glucoamylase